MRWLMMVLATLFIGAVAHAEPVLLACYGEMHVLGVAGVRQLPEKYSLPIAIDVETKSIKVGTYDLLPLMGDPKDDTVGFLAKPGSKYGVSTGTLNRVTGAASINFLPPEGGVLGFEGICKPAKKLF